ncbi:MAG: ABC transporter permease [Deltaproteobacteria bacterium]|nr:MAG: ABC transporter permease [Deltaproteobacteria bacterium]
MSQALRKTNKFIAFFQLFFGHPMGFAGLAIITIFVIMAVFAPFLGTVDPSASGEVDNLLLPPSSQFWFGTDDLARDIWSQTIYGSRISLTIGFVAALITVFSGTLVGLVAGYYGKFMDEVLMRIVDFFMMLPELPLMIVLAAVLGPSMWNIILVVSLVSWPTTARVVRSQVLSLKERPFVESSRCIGASNFQLMFSEILPNVVPLMFAQAVIMITEAIYAEAVLSFLGLGDPTSISWGMMLHSVFESGVISESYWWVSPPIVSIVILIVSFSLLGTAVSDILEPGYKEKKGY